MGTPHKHAELIKAWADGAEIELRTVKWEPCPYPSWSPNTEYRIKPEPKPDEVRWGCVKPMKAETYWWRTHRHEGDNLKIVFDGETGKLKKVKMLDE